MIFSVVPGVTALLCLFHTSTLNAACIEDGSQEVTHSSIQNSTEPDSYPGYLYNIESQKYYNEDGLPIQGPCGKFMLLYKENDKLAICKCQIKSTNAGRPLVYYDTEKRCYYSYEQGPCKSGEWFVYNNQSKSECQRNPCPVSPSTKDGYDIMPLNFYFTDQKGNCYRTNTSDYCQDKKQRVFFIGTGSNPICLLNDPPEFNQEFGVSSPITCPKGTKLENDGGCAKVVSFS